MARRLSTKTNVVAPGGAYPYGRIKDDSGLNDGTPVNELLYGDQHQFFERLLEMSQITPNGLVENDTNGFQLYEALGFWKDAGTTLVPETPADFTIPPGSVLYNKYRILGNTVQWQVRILGATVANAPTDLGIEFPAGITVLPNNNLGRQLGVYNNEVMFVYPRILSGGVRFELPALAPFTNGTLDQNFDFHITMEMS